MEKSGTKKAARMSGEERREQILDTACVLFAQNGYDAVTTRQLSEALGCSESLIFRHFPTKEAIYTTLMREWEAGMSEPIELELVYGSALKTLEKLYNEILISREWRKNSQTRPRLEAAMLSRTGMSRQHMAILAKSPDTVQEYIVPLVKLGQETGEIRPGNVDELAHLFWFTLMGAWYLTRHFPDRHSRLPFSSIAHILK